MNEDEAIRFAEDLETGAFRCTTNPEGEVRDEDIKRHKITLDIQNLVYNGNVTFEEYWQ